MAQSVGPFGDPEVTGAPPPFEFEEPWETVERMDDLRLSPSPVQQAASSESIPVGLGVMGSGVASSSGESMLPVVNDAGTPGSGITEQVHGVDPRGSQFSGGADSTAGGGRGQTSEADVSAALAWIGYC